MMRQLKRTLTLSEVEVGDAVIGHLENKDIPFGKAPDIGFKLDTGGYLICTITSTDEDKVNLI